jgi:hypothetical protein
VRALTAAALPLVAGPALGAASRLVVPDTAPRVAAVLFTCFGVAASIAPAFGCGADRVAERLKRAGVVAVLALAFAWTAAAVAGDASALGGAAVVASGALAAFALSALFASRGASASRAPFLGSLAVSVLAGLVFVADPFVDWHPGEGSLGRSSAVLSASPLASIGADAGIDWQRSRWLYDGPPPGTQGLSVIGQFYPSSPSPPWLWSLAAVVVSAAAVCAARPRSMLPA